MENNFQPKLAMPTIWEANPKLKTLLLVLIFVFLASGIGLVIFAQVQAEYRQKIYEETKAGLPKHTAGESENRNVGESDTANWKTYRNEEYGFEFKYPSTLELRVSEIAGTYSAGPAVIAFQLWRPDSLDYEYTLDIYKGDVRSKINEKESKIIFRNNYTYQFFRFENGFSEAYKKMFESIFSTFKFIK